MPKAHIPSYPDVRQIGHLGMLKLLNNKVIIQEKVDGSQFSFGLLDGELLFRSKNHEFTTTQSITGLFSRAVDYVLHCWHNKKLRPNIIYRCEYLEKPKHNIIQYQRVPENYLALFGAEYWPVPAPWVTDLNILADELGIEVVPSFEIDGEVTAKKLEQLLTTPSFLGNSAIEGVVVKNFFEMDSHGKFLVGKLVRQDFRETNSRSLKKAKDNKNSLSDLIKNIAEGYSTEARRLKALQHLREKGELKGDNRDIPKIMIELGADVLKEQEQAIKETLFGLLWPHIRREITEIVPEWYKQQLISSTANTGEPST